MVLIIGLIIGLAIFWIQGAINMQTFALFAGGIILAYLFYRKTEQNIDLPEAMKRAYDFLKSEQHKTNSSIRNGTIRVLDDSKPIYIVTSDEMIIPYKYVILLNISSDRGDYRYLVDVSIKGKIVGICEIKEPDWSTFKNIEEFKYIRGKFTEREEKHELEPRVESSEQHE